MIKNKILITGAAGFIGSHLVDLLLTKGFAAKQLLLVIAPWDTLENLKDHGELNIVRLDIRNTKELEKIVTGCNYIVHLAAKIDFDGTSYQEYKDVNVTPTAALLRSAIKNSVKRFIFFSSIGVHGLPAGIGPIENWNESHPATYTNFYGQSKWRGEEIVRYFHRTTGLPYTIIRPVSVYGPREKGPTLALYKAIKAHLFMMIGTGNNLLHYVYVKDLVMATFLALQSHKSNGEFIIGGPKPEQFKEIVKSVASSINTQLLPLSIPISIAMFLATILEWVYAIVGKKAPLYPERVRTMTTTYYYDQTKAKQELNYKPQYSFKEGATLTGKWYLDHLYL
ncbi:MAG: hypothetical protein COY81_00185 [Candidatus Pacebacteria bacterium CG_4_10_14_0_8_um_filter_43_12]|nr:MAG: hypothetical protein COY81_00185 [Candidatus Pacebacteria bacterium CG_4_10_14_0_8_um_filter_43_12]